MIDALIDAIPSSLAFNLNFLHPLLMWVLLGLTLYAMVLGIKAKKTRTGTPEQRKELVKGQFGRRHFQMGSLLLALMVLGTVGGMVVTYINNGKLFVGPHLLVGLAMTSLIAVAAALSPLMQAGSVLARKIHVGLNMTLVSLFLWQAVSGMQIVQKLLSPAV
jgi:ABC-type transport system involved in cytochrome c biogenesis permease subunit